MRVYRSMATAMTLPVLFHWFTAIGLTALGSPGVVCITPVAWLFTVFVGRDDLNIMRKTA
jgi:hypothetical protein